MHVPYPMPLAADALEGLILLVLGPPWLARMLEQGVSELEKHRVAPLAPPGLEQAPQRPSTQVKVLDGASQLLAAMAPSGGLHEQRSRVVVLVDDGVAGCDPASLVSDLARQGWKVLFCASSSRHPGLPQSENLRVWPAPNIAEVAFQIAQLRKPTR